MKHLTLINLSSLSHTMRNAKAKGSKGERELVAFFNENGWNCVRIAGSGSSKYPCPDILAGNAIRRLAIECKVTKDKT
jgi:Holliday junction resolvase